jgi:glyoxylase-like metal-dependent hydrolase (beta-lactamase superfamily II)
VHPIFIPAGNPGPLTGRGNNTWLLDGPRPALVDAGVGATSHVEAIAAALGGRALACVLVTHGHRDHDSGVPALRARWPHLEALKLGGDSAAGWRAVNDGDRLAAGTGELLAVATPGHASDHVCFWDESSGDLFAGDMVVAGGTVMIPPGARGGSLRAYLASLDRLAALRPRRILPGHGPAIDRPLDLISEYVAHRRQREEQVRACLRDGLTDPRAIVARIYPELAAPLHDAARLTVEAHLEKIRDEGSIE